MANHQVKTGMIEVPREADWGPGWRDRVWADLDQGWDIIVVGGGITGAGILREATRAGLRTLLLEAKDFAAGTSSRSSKLVHGGLRYLRNAQFKTTLTSVRERDILLAEGKGLIKPLPYMHIIFERDRMPLWLFGVALSFYDLLAWHWSHQRLAPEQVRALEPTIGIHSLVGGFSSADAQVDDARLVLRLIRESAIHGGTALNYARAEEILTNRRGEVAGVAVRDIAPDGGGRTKEIQAGVVINATGVGADHLRSMVGRRKRLRPLRGSHLVLPDQRLPVSRAIGFAHPVDHRPVFALPWQGVTLFGTTDVDCQFDPDAEPSISPQEVDYLLVALNHAFPSLRLAESDVRSTFAGIRAVIDTGKVDPSRESREHVIWQEDGLLTVAGGKLTTFHAMALQALRAVKHRLPVRGRFRGKDVFDEASDCEVPECQAPDQCLRLMGRYGLETSALVSAAQGEDWQPVGDSRTLWAELRWAARSEGVVHLDDLLLRRTRIGITQPEGALPWLAQLRRVVQPELGWSDERWEAELTSYKELWQSAYHLPD